MGRFSIVLIGNLGCLLGSECGLVQLVVVGSPPVYRTGNRLLRLGGRLGCLIV